MNLSKQRSSRKRTRFKETNKKDNTELFSLDHYIDERDFVGAITLLEVYQFFI